MSGVGFGGTCGIGGAGKSDKVITGVASKALPERCKQKNPPLKNSGSDISLHIQKILVYSCIAVKLRVEGCHKLIFLSCGYYFSVHLRENLYIVINLVDIRRTDKRHRNFSDTLKLRFGMETAELSAISVAVGNNGHCLQVLCTVV